MWPPHCPDGILLTITEITPSFLPGLRLNLLRADLLHDQAAGPKNIRLNAWLTLARAQGYRRVVTAGGMHSNHLHALAMLAPAYGLQAKAYVRGLAYTPPNLLLAEAAAAGMELHAVSKGDYAAWGLGGLSPTIDLDLTEIWIPMGADGPPGQAALDAWAQTVWAQLPCRTQLALTAGTGSTLQAFAGSMPAGAHLWVAAPFKDMAYLQSRVPADKQHQTTMLAGAHRFGKVEDRALQLAQIFVQETGIGIDNLYMPTLLTRLADALADGLLRPDHPWAILHCGGQSVNRLTAIGPIR